MWKTVFVVEDIVRNCLVVDGLHLPCILERLCMLQFSCYYFFPEKQVCSKTWYALNLFLAHLLCKRICSVLACPDFLQLLMVLLIENKFTWTCCFRFQGKISCSVYVNPENQTIIEQDCYPEVSNSYCVFLYPTIPCSWVVLICNFCFSDIAIGWKQSSWLGYYRRKLFWLLFLLCFHVWSDVVR